MKAIIPTGGRGTRMQPLTFSTNKHFIPIANKPLIFYPVEAIAGAGIKEVAITYHPGTIDYVKSYLGNGEKWNLKFTYIVQEQPLGLANIFQVCEEYLAGESFLMHLGDNIFSDGIKDLVEHFYQKRPNGLVSMVHHPENTRLGVPYFDKQGRLQKYVEKPSNPPHDFAIPGIYFFDNNVFKCFKGKDKITPSARGEYEISSPFQWLIDHGYRVDVIEYKGKWLDPGKFDDWLESNQFLLDHNLKSEILSKVPSSVKIKNRVAIGKSCVIADAEIRGPVVIGDNVEIKGSFIGPYTSVSDGCYIEDSRIENSVIMPGVRITKIKQSIDESIIGTGTELSNNSGPSTPLKLFVGERCQIEI